MSVVLITGSNGLVGSESVNFFSDKGFKVVGVDNDLRKYFLVTMLQRNGKINTYKKK